MTATTRATAASVAARAGVSVASVSRILNGHSAAAATTARVQAAAEELGYRPDVSARALKIGRTQQLALAVADIGNPVYVAMMRAVEDVVRRAGYRLVLSSMSPGPTETVQVIDDMARGYADGLLISPLRLTDEILAALLRLRVPVVVVGALPAGVALDNVRADSPRGVRLAVEHLRGLGRRRIAFLNGPRDTVPGAARGRAFDRMVRALDLDPDPALRGTAAEFTYRAGEVAAAELLDRTRPEAILGANDLIAIGALRVLSRLRLAVPDDVAVVGMDDTDLAQLTTPTLTSVDLGATVRGRRAAELLLARLADPSLPARQIRVPPSLVVRGSTGRTVAA